MCVCVCVCAFVCLHVCVYMCVHVCVHECMCVHVRASICVHVCGCIYVTGSAKRCQDAGIFENPFLTFYNSVMQGDYNALCFTSVACSVAKLRAPPFPCSAEERLE